MDVGPLLRFLERQGRIVHVEQDRFYDARELEGLVDRLRASMADHAERSPAELRDALGVSRKFLIPFLEYCDRAGYTIRNASGRVWHDT